MVENYDVTTVIVDETVATTIPNTDLEALKTAFNDIKKGDITDHSKLTDKFTLKGMKEFKEKVTDAMLKIEEFSNKGKQQSTTSGLGSKALALVGGEEGTLGRWLGKRRTDVKVEALEQKTITQLLSTLRVAIETKREEVVAQIEEMRHIRAGVINRINQYKALDEVVTKLALEAPEFTRMKLDAEQLATMTKTAIVKSTNNLKSYIEPLITAATITVQQVQNILPTIEDDLQSKLTYKAYQEDLKTIHDMTTTTQHMAKSIGTIINDDVRNTIYESITFLSNTGVDMKEYEALANKEKEHQIKVSNMLQSAADNISKEFKRVQTVHENLIANKPNDNIMIEYSS